MWKGLVLLVAACGGGAAPTRAKPTVVISNSVPGPAKTGALFNIEAGSLGPIVPTTPANEAALQELFGSRFVVKGVDDHGMEFHVYLGDEKLFYVIPNDDGSLFNVHVTSPKVGIAEHPEWVIGSPFTNDAPLTTCECWGSHPVCFKNGDHVAVAFEISCDGLDTPEARHTALANVRIQRAVWNPQPFSGGQGGASSSSQQTPSLLAPPP